MVRPKTQGVGVVPTDGDRVLLVQQWRHTVQKLPWEIPAGGKDADEDAAHAAARELREETGYEAGEIRPLYRYHPSIGSSAQTFNLFIASSLTRVGEPDVREIHDLRWFSRSEIEQLISTGEQVDGMSLTALLMWLACRGGPPCPPCCPHQEGGHGGPPLQSWAFGAMPKARWPSGCNFSITRA